MEESDGPPEFLICRNLRFIPSTLTDNIEQLEREIEKLNITEVTSVIPSTQPIWPVELKIRYPTILKYKQSARDGYRCYTFVVILYNQ